MAKTTNSEERLEMIKETVIAVSVVTMAAGAALAPTAASAGEQPIVVASCNPCDPCNPCGACNPCDPCNPCGGCNPCGSG